MLWVARLNWGSSMVFTGCSNPFKIKTIEAVCLCGVHWSSMLIWEGWMEWLSATGAVTRCWRCHCKTNSYDGYIFEHLPVLLNKKMNLNVQTNTFMLIDVFNGSVLLIVTYECLCMYVCIQIYVYMCVHTCVHVCTHIHVHTYINVYVYMYTHPQICVHMYMCVWSLYVIGFQLLITSTELEKQCVFKSTIYLWSIGSTNAAPMYISGVFFCRGILNC
jgi:hypothetical protein